MQRKVSVGIAIDSNMQGAVPYDGIGFPYPIYVTYPDRSDDFAYALTKAVVSHHAEITEALKNADGYGIDRQLFDWALPYHPGAIKYYKEINAWTPEAEKHNQMLLKRQDVLAAAWDKVKAMDLSDDEHAKKWRAERAAALAAAGLTVTFK